MSCSYAEGLSPYDNKGKLGLPEAFDSSEEVHSKVKQLATWMRGSRHTVFFTGAGISTAAGIPDFRGPNGVWTLEKKGLKPQTSVSWGDANPTKAHMAIKRMTELNLTQFVVSQNIDGLHMRSGLERKFLAEVHGNMFVEACPVCRKQFIRSSPAPTVGQKTLGVACPQSGRRGKPCRGKLVDFVLDWEDELPESDLVLSHSHSVLSELSIVVGSTLQIVPAGTMPTFTKKYQKNGRLVIINLQPTKHDKKADLLIRCRADEVFEKLLRELGHEIPLYKEGEDPIKLPPVAEWTQSAETVKTLEALSRIVEKEYKQSFKSTNRTKS